MSSVKVAVRVRPFNGREKERGSTCVVSMDGNSTREHSSKLAKDVYLDNYSVMVKAIYPELNTCNDIHCVKP